MLERIISGGDTGVDRAALDVAHSLGIACGGWCPRGRVADDGRIDGYPHGCAASAGVLNVAGPRERKRRGIYRDARRFLLRVLPR